MSAAGRKLPSPTPIERRRAVASKPFGRALPEDAALHGRDVDRIEPRIEPRDDPDGAKVDRRALRPPPAEIDPALDLARAGLEYEREIDPRPQGAEIEIRRVKVEAARRRGEAGAASGTELAAHVDEPADLGRRPRPQRDPVLPAAALEMDEDVGEFERGCAARLVDPGELRVADLHLRLREHPVGEAAVRAVELHRHARDRELARPVAAHDEVRPFDEQRAQSHRTREHRAPAQDGVDAFEPQPGAPLRIVDDDVAQREPRMQSVPVAGECADGDGLADGAGDRSGDRLAEMIDVRQEVEAECDDERGEDDGAGEHEVAENAQRLRQDATERSGEGRSQQEAGVLEGIRARQAPRVRGSMGRR
jgi:hypothetical protein